MSTDDAAARAEACVLPPIREPKLDSGEISTIVELRVVSRGDRFSSLRGSITDGLDRDTRTVRWCIGRTIVYSVRNITDDPVQALYQILPGDRTTG